MTSAQPVVVLIGAPGSGKTRIGKRVARLLDVPFIDTDKRIVADHGSIAEIFAERGEPFFRELERAAIVEALHERAVLSVGGGAVMHPQTQQDFAEQRVVRLTVSPEAVVSRITGGKRPLLASGIDAWKQIVEIRRPVYEALADKTWDTSSRPIDHIAQEIADWVAADAELSAPGIQPRTVSAKDISP
jgi:shikimate kinase